MIELTDKELSWEFLKLMRGFLDRGQISHKEFDDIVVLGLYHNTCWDWSSPSIDDRLEKIISANHSEGTPNTI